MDTFRDIVIADAKKQEGLINPFFNNTPILDSMPVRVASHTYYNVAQVVREIDGPSVTDIGGTLPTIGMTSELKQFDLKIIGGIMEVNKDKAAALGGVGRYFADNIDSTMQEGFQKWETEIYYNSLRKFALDNGKAVSVGGDQNKNYSMVCVRYSLVGNIGLVSPNYFGAGKMFNVMRLSGGEPYKNTAGEIVYGQVIQTAFGVQTLLKKHIAAIVNIDMDSPTTHLPTEQQINRMLSDAQAMPGDTFIYCHRNMVDYLSTFKSSRLQMAPVDANYNNVVGFWNSIPLVSSYNLMAGTEANVSVA